MDGGALSAGIRGLENVLSVALAEVARESAGVVRLDRHDVRRATASTAVHLRLDRLQRCFEVGHLLVVAVDVPRNGVGEPPKKNFWRFTGGVDARAGTSERGGDDRGTHIEVLLGPGDYRPTRVTGLRVTA